MTMHQAETSAAAGSNSEDRGKLISRLATRFEQVETDLAIIAEDVKLITKDGADAGLSKAEMIALKRLAKLKVADKLESEREKMSAMAIIGTAMGIDLFSWAESREPE